MLAKLVDRVGRLEATRDPLRSLSRSGQALPERVVILRMPGIHIRDVRFTNKAREAYTSVGRLRRDFAAVSYVSRGLFSVRRSSPWVDFSLLYKVGPSEISDRTRPEIPDISKPDRGTCGPCQADRADP